MRPITRKMFIRSVIADSSRCRASHKLRMCSVGELLVAKYWTYLQESKTKVKLGKLSQYTFCLQTYEMFYLFHRAVFIMFKDKISIYEIIKGTTSKKDLLFLYFKTMETEFWHQAAAVNFWCEYHLPIDSECWASMRQSFPLALGGSNNIYNCEYHLPIDSECLGQHAPVVSSRIGWV